MLLRSIVIGLLAALPAMAVEALPEVSSGVIDWIAGERAAADATALTHLEGLDRLAEKQARAIAALPHRQRLAYAEPIDDDALRSVGIERFLNIVTHTDLHRGYPDHAAAFAASIRKYRPIAERIVEPQIDGIGAAVVRADDGWVILVTLLIEGYGFAFDLASVEAEVVERSNALRLERELVALTPDPELSEVARRHSRDMARRGYFDHADRRGRGVDFRVERAEVDYRSVGENLFLAQGYPDPARRAAEGWLDSPGHRKNLLAPRWRRTGVGVAVDDEGTIYITQIYLEPR